MIKKIIKEIQKLEQQKQIKQNKKNQLDDELNMINSRLKELNNLKNQYEKLERRVTARETEAHNRLELAKAMKNSQEDIVKNRAKELHEKQKEELEAQFNKIKKTYGVWFGMTIAYGIICTFFTAMRSERFLMDFKDFFYKIGIAISFIVKNVLKMANWALDGCIDNIPVPILCYIVGWLLWAVIFLGICGGICFLLGKLIFKLCSLYSQKVATKPTAMIFLVCLAIVVFFAEPIRKVVPINLMLLLILSQALYAIVKGFKFPKDEFSYWNYMG